jgi:hypothetical protein
MSIEIQWTTLLAESEEWHHAHVLYAYLDPETDEILYVGMAWRRTVRQRFTDRDKRSLFNFLFNERGVRGVKVLVGSVWMDGRLTRQLLSNVESLLIKRLKPAGNVMCRTSRLSRPGMRLECFHEWPDERTRFVDL